MESTHLHTRIVASNNTTKLLAFVFSASCSSIATHRLLPLQQQQLLPVVAMSSMTKA
jgi:hypothetical protein